MVKKYKKLMRTQVQDDLNDYGELAQKPIPKQGWIRTIREALGISSDALSKLVGCSQGNIIKLEKNESRKAITLQKLEEIAHALQCKLVYSLVPVKSLEEIREDQARSIVRKRVARVDHSMQLEGQGLTVKQLKRQERRLVQEILEGTDRSLWRREI